MAIFYRKRNIFLSSLTFVIMYFIIQFLFWPTTKPSLKKKKIIIFKTFFTWEKKIII